MVVQPVVVVHHVSIEQDHYLLPLLSTQCRVVSSRSTTPSSLVFPSLRSSCLLLDCCTPAPISQHLEQCLAFLKSNTGPFILLTPAKALHCRSPIRCSELGLKLSLALQREVWGALVLVAITPALALSTILQLVEPSTSTGQAVEAARAALLPGKKPVEALAGTVCRDRVDSILLLTEITSLANIEASINSLPQEIQSALQNNSEVKEDM